MADYSFLFDKAKEQAFIERCAAAALVLADTIRGEASPPADDTAWAQQTFRDPQAAGKIAAAVVVAANSGASETVINNATDAQIQTNVDAARSTLVAGAATA